MRETYVTADIHGQYDAFIKGIHDLLKPGDRLVVLGDAADRGPKGYQMLEYLLLCPPNDIEVVMLRGNHEQMFLEFVDEVKARAKLRGIEIGTIEEFLDWADEHSFDSYWTRVNGGDTTLLDLRRNVRSIDELSRLCDMLSALPYHLEVECNGVNFYLVHGEPAAKDNERMLWESTKVNSDYSRFGDCIVFGHTTTWHYKQEHENKWSVFYGNQIIGIDTGAAFPEYGGRLSFLRLSDLRAFYYDV